MIQPKLDFIPLKLYYDEANNLMRRQQFRSASGPSPFIDPLNRTNDPDMIQCVHAISHYQNQPDQM
jgi:hypothetical protein